MDVTFRELKPYYSLEATSPFGDSLDTVGMRREGESSNSDDERRMVSVGGTSCPREMDLARVEPEVERIEPKGGRTQAEGESRYSEVYVRRKKLNEGAVPIVPHVPSPLFLPTPTLETPIPSTLNSEYTGDMIPLSTPPTPLSVRRNPRKNAGIPPDRYGFPCDIAKYVSYSQISLVHGALIASLDIVSIPKCWQVAKGDSKWKAAMLEELGALCKNKT